MYVVQIKNLTGALKHCLKLKIVHRIIKFEQSYRMRSYIALKTFLSLWTLAFLGKLWRILETTKTWKWWQSEKNMPTIWWMQTLEIGRVICCRDGKKLDQDEWASVTWTNKSGLSIRKLMCESPYDFMHLKYRR